MANERAWEEAEERLEEARVLEVAKMFWRTGFTKEASELLKMVVPRTKSAKRQKTTARRSLRVFQKYLTGE